MKVKSRHPREKGLVTNNAKQRGWQSPSERLGYERSGNLREGERQENKRGHTARPSEDPPRTRLLRGTRQMPMKAEEPASLRLLF